MTKEQFNVRMPDFAHAEFAHLQRSLRLLGYKPDKGDLVAALIHAARESGAEHTKALVEAWVIYELGVEDAGL